MGHANPGVQIETLDSVITIMRMSHVIADIWQEDELDILLHLTPPDGELAFDAYTEVVRPQLEACVARVMGTEHDVLCDEFGWRHGDAHVSRKSDPLAKGMDMFQLRLLRVYKRPMAASRIVECMKMFNQVLAGKHPPLEPPQSAVSLT